MKSGGRGAAKAMPGASELGYAQMHCRLRQAVGGIEPRPTAATDRAQLDNWG